MRVTLLTALLAAGSTAHVLPRDAAAATSGAAAAAATSNIGIAPSNTIPVFNTHKWPLLDPTQALHALHKKAKATPSAVSILPGVPLPSTVAEAVDEVGQLVDSITGGLLETENSKHAVGGAKLTELAAAPKVEATKVKTAQDATAAGSCTNPSTVYEWRNLSDAHKQQMVVAIRCLTTTSARSGLPGAHSRWGDLSAVHQHMSSTIHNVGQFLPWHRYFMWIYEQELRNTCGYTGPMTWWDETKDAGNFNGAPMMTQQYFGHMPNGNDVCIISGEFAGLELYVGPGQSNTAHCLSRGCNEGLSADITMNFVNTCNSYNDFEDMNNCQFFGPHAYGHDAVGAVMSDVDSSPGDPVFFLHHGFVNRNWRIWQRTNPGPRTYAIGGSTTQNCGNNCQPTTLNYVLSSLGFYPSVTVDQVMDTEGGFLCYHYDY